MFIIKFLGDIFYPLKKINHVQSRLYFTISNLVKSHQFFNTDWLEQALLRLMLKKQTKVSMFEIHVFFFL